MFQAALGLFLGLILAFEPAVAAAAPLFGTRRPKPAPALAAVPVRPTALSLGLSAPEAPALSSLPPKIEAIAADALALGQAPAESARATGQRHIEILTGEAAVRASETVSAGNAAPADAAAMALPPHGHAARGILVPRPPAASSAGGGDARPPSVRWMLFGVSAFKVGLEAIRLAMPLLAFQIFGTISAIAVVHIVDGLSQAASSAGAGKLMDRFPANKVLSASVALQAAVMAGLLILDRQAALAGWMIFPFCGLLGAAAGITETSRRVIVPLILGTENVKALERYNARQHLFYESSGIAGVALAGLIAAWTQDPLKMLLVHPPAYLAAAAAFWMASHPFSRAQKKAAEAARTGFGGVWREIRESADALAAVPWIAVALILPFIAHRLMEKLLIPTFATKVLENGAGSAWMQGACNIGEFIGAILLLKGFGNAKGRFAWVFWVGLGMIGLWGFAAQTLSMVLPFILLSSLTWAASDLSLWSHVQSRLPEQKAARAMGLLFGLATAGEAVLYFFLGRFMDAASLSTAFAAVNAGLSAAAVLVWLAWRKLRAH